MNHRTAAAWVKANRRRFLTTDYVIDETLTLMRSRGERNIALGFGAEMYSGILTAIYFLTEPDLAAAWGVFSTFADKDWSFTDCTSKVVIEKLGIPEAFTFDHHFRQFGTVAVVP